MTVRKNVFVMNYAHPQTGVNKPTTNNRQRKQPQPTVNKDDDLDMVPPTMSWEEQPTQNKQKEGKQGQSNIVVKNGDADDALLVPTMAWDESCEDCPADDNVTDNQADDDMDMVPRNMTW